MWLDSLSSMGSTSIFTSRGTSSGSKAKRPRDCHRSSGCGLPWSVRRCYRSREFLLSRGHALETRLTDLHRLFWFGWTARPSIHWLSPVAAEAFFSCGNLLIFVCASLYMTDCYGALYGASAWSSNTFLRYLFATAFPLFALQMFEALGVGWASSLLGFLTVALMPIPFVFYKYGPSLRANSKFPSGE